MKGSIQDLFLKSILEQVSETDIGFLQLIYTCALFVGLKDILFDLHKYTLLLFTWLLYLW